MKYLIFFLLLVSCQKINFDGILENKDCVEYYYSEAHHQRSLERDLADTLNAYTYPTINGRLYTWWHDEADFLKYIPDSTGQYNFKMDGTDNYFNIDTISMFEVYRIWWPDAEVVYIDCQINVYE